MPTTQRMRVVAAITALGLVLAARSADAAERHFSFGYDQPHTTAYGFAADTFANKLKELSGGAMIIDQFPGGQLGQEPQMLQKIRTGDIDFILPATANAATVSPEAGVFSIHFIFRGEDHLKKAISDPKVVGGLSQDDQGHGAGLPGADLAHPRLPRLLQQEGDPQHRRPQRPQDPRAGDADRGHLLYRLWRAGRPHAVRRGLHVTADRASSTPPRTASTSTCRTSTTRWRR